MTLFEQTWSQKAMMPRWVAVLFWVGFLAIFLLAAIPLVGRSNGAGIALPASLASEATFSLSEEPPVDGDRTYKQPIETWPASAIGTASLALQGTIPLDEADNLRWSLVRRTPAAARVYTAERGVDWSALREIEAEGDIWVPAGFTWSFNETFSGGPGYKQASGILAGGHCALATVFNAAAKAAGLPTQYRQHRTPFPGYAPAESVNIFWGRDDLTVLNTLGNDLRLHWRLTHDMVQVEVIPVGAGDRPALPSIGNATIAMVYGRPRSGRWGTLGQTSIVDQAIHVAYQFASRADLWNGEKPVVVAVNPNVIMGGESKLDELYVYHLIAEAERRGVYVMLDVQTGQQDPLEVFSALMDKYLRENVWLDWDIEHAADGRVDASQINEIAAAYFQRRAERGYQQPGIFAFYVFDLAAVRGVEELQRTYENGFVVPIFDGYGAKATKLAKTEEFRQFFGGLYGIMEFESRWGTRYDGISAQEYLAAYPDTLIFASQ